jgi:hypothetical protein
LYLAQLTTQKTSDYYTATNRGFTFITYECWALPTLTGLSDWVQVRKIWWVLFCPDIKKEALHPVKGGGL